MSDDNFGATTLREFDSMVVINKLLNTGSPHITLFLFFMKSSVKWNSCKVKHSILILK